MLGTIIGIAIASVLGFSVACGLAEQLSKDAQGYRIKRSRSASYVVCTLAVFTCSVIFAEIVALPVEPGDEIGGKVANYYRPGLSLERRDEIAMNTFLVLLPSTLIGVRVGLGKAGVGSKTTQ